MVFGGALVAGILAGASGPGHAADPASGAAIRQQLQSFATLGSVLYIAAHPDDENTQVIAYLARGGAIARPTSRSPAATAARTCSGPSSASSWGWPAPRSC